MSKKAVKQKSDNIFEKYTGYKLYQLIMKGDKKKCLIAPCTRILFSGSQHMVGHVAAALYLNKPISEMTTVIQTCGIKNCVDPTHLLVDGILISEPAVDKRTGQPEKEIDSPDANGDIHGIHPSVWDQFNDYQKSLARTGKYDQATIGFMKEPPTTN